MKQGLFPGVVMMMITSAALAGPVPLCVTSAGDAAGIKDSGTKQAELVRKALEKEKTLTLVACDQAVVVVTVADSVRQETQTKMQADWTKKSGQSPATSVTQYLGATLTVPSKSYTTDLEGSHLAQNMFTAAGSPAKSLAGKVKAWVKDNAATLTPQ